MIDTTDAGLLLDTVESLDKYLADAKVPSTNPDRVKYAVLKDKLKDVIDSPQPDAFTIEETKQLRILLVALMARIHCTVRIDIKELIEATNSSPDAYKVEINPNADGTQVEIKFTGSANTTFSQSELNKLVGYHAAKV
jgi:hypothetical protein